MSSEVLAEFDQATQSLTALRAAAYRLIGTATCQIEQSGGRYICRLVPTGHAEPEGLRIKYLELVADENVREDLRGRTEPYRNLILSLAFGALAAEKSDAS